jgi:hypothetical protein
MVTYIDLGLYYGLQAVGIDPVAEGSCVDVCKSY